MEKAMQKYLDKAEVLIEALPYIQRFNRKVIVVKYGGSAMVDEELKARVIQDVTLLKLVGFKPIIVHGGGKEISKWVGKVGMEPHFINGLRVTDAETMELAEMVLGKVNKSLVQLVEQLGVRAIGISGKDGGLLKVDKKLADGEDIGFVGDVKEVNADIIYDLLEKDFLPIIAPIGLDDEYNTYNINADDAACAIAKAINAEKLAGQDLRIKKDASVPQILIYHTHSQETFADSRPGERADTVIGLGDDLQELLEKQYGYEVLHITEAFDMKEGCLERSRAYNYAEPVIAAALEEHPSIQVVIDLHRDGVNGSKRLVTEINGKPTAQIMFFNGLSRTKESGELTSLPNPYQAENLAFSFQMEYEAEQYYPGFSRCIYLKGYRYNLHLRPRSVLLEVGAQTNTVEEVKNAMGPFSDILHKVLSGKSPASGG